MHLQIDRSWVEFVSTVGLIFPSLLFFAHPILPTYNTILQFIFRFYCNRFFYTSPSTSFSSSVISAASEGSCYFLNILAPILLYRPRYLRPSLLPILAASTHGNLHLNIRLSFPPFSPLEAFSPPLSSSFSRSTPFPV
ncbi:hypothetical protein M440DRAFT_1113298 [Trichoderma longibrachiatum ATCC 18648]|uniref:Uncharacterized protein n=1 Tax=Trichoderma longibrachiatum ATCC 18648 TaxID=983965 RepID=A0A2T4CF19_TRILO|nr:hypothetical protein M440DRAFT_1113298 [Trichoderma longibrachiatum ATCC 18648]